MDIFHAIILGIVEGLTEFLPVSSTGHLILTAHLLGLEQSEFLKTFEIVIQSGAILAVMVLYWRRLLLDWETLKRVCVAFLPTGILGLLLYPHIKVWLGSETIVLASLFFGGVILILFEYWHQESFEVYTDISTLSYFQAIALGCFQSLAMIPGVSRSGATILGGLILGFKRATIVEFSFLLAIPTMLAATGLDLLKHFQAFSSADTQSLAVGFGVSFVVALVAIRWFLRYVQHHTFTSFGIYRMVVAIAFFVFLA
jgi:undecaprenyl-diphosphatase